MATWVGGGRVERKGLLTVGCVRGVQGPMAAQKERSSRPGMDSFQRQAWGQSRGQQVGPRARSPGGEAVVGAGVARNPLLQQTWSNAWLPRLRVNGVTERQDLRSLHVSMVQVVGKGLLSRQVKARSQILPDRVPRPCAHKSNAPGSRGQRACLLPPA